MEWNIVVATFVCSIAFGYYFFILTSQYLQYETLTEANVYPKDEINGLENVLCVSIPPILKQLAHDPLPLNNTILINETMEQEEFIKNFTTNQVPLTLRKPYIWSNIYKCWSVEIASAAIQSDDYFQLESSINLNLLSWVMKFIPGRSLNDIPNQRYPMEHGNWKRVVNTHIVLSLKSPYDTDCFNYEMVNMTSQSRCIAVCPNSEACNKMCARQDCTKLIFEDHFRASPPSPNIGIYFSNRFNLRFQSQPRITPSTFLLQTVGLVAMFFEVAIVSFVLPVRNFIKILHKKLIKKFRLRKNKSQAAGKRIKRKKYWKMVKKCLTLIVYIGFIVHIALATSNYFEFKTLSETFIGSPIKKYSPSLSVCFDHEQRHDIKPIWIARKIKAEQLFHLDLPHFIRTFFKNRDICFQVTFANSSYDTLGIIYFHRLGVNLVVKFYISPRNSFPRNSRPVWASTNIQILFFTQVLDYSSLPPPYSSNCFNYNQIGVESRTHCYDKCLIRNFTTNFGLFPKDVINDHHFKIAYSPSVPSDVLVQLCRQQCQRGDCNSIEFFIVSRVLKSSIGLINLKSPSEAISIKLLPHLGLVDFLTYLATTFGFWLGISCISLSSEVFKFGSLVDVVSKHGLVFKSLIWGLLLSGLSFHIYQLIDSYLQYATVSVITMGSPKTLSLPSLSLVFSLNNHTVRTPPVSAIPPTFSPKTFNNQFMELSDMLHRVQLIDPRTNDWRNYENSSLSSVLLHTYEYIVQMAKMVTIDLSSIQPHVYEGSKIRGKESFVRMSFNSKISQERSMYHLILHTGSYYDIGIDETPFDPKHETCKYDQTVTSLLPAPYPSNCINYPNPLTGNNTWFKCVINSFTDGKLPFELALPSRYTGSRVYKPIQNMRQKRNCIELYKSKPECDSILYRSETEKKLAIDKDWDIVVQVPTEEVFCQFTPKTTILDLVIFLGDAFGIWLGINMFFIVKKLISPVDR